MNTATYIFLAACALVIPRIQTAEPDFDCAKVDHDVERLICSDDALAALDSQLAKAYRTAYETFPTAERGTLKAYQRGWIKGRNDCWKATDQRGCVRSAYETRITELQIQGGDLVVPAPIAYQCDGDAYDDLTAFFYPRTAVPSVVLTRGDNQAIAFIAPSGSGAKYEGGNVSFWEHQGEAAVTWNGKAFRCKPR